jgi:photosystem II stability/assembly factor-like uncharacterized protein
MKSVIKLSFISLLLISANIEAQWFSQNSEVTVHLGSVSFINETRGWAAGDSGTILSTSNGGNNWERQTTNYTTPLLSISFCDESNGWAVGDYGIILKTTNQGNDWSRVYNDTSINIRNFKVQCISPTTTIVLRDSNTGDFHQETKIWKTANGGETWEDISPYENDFSFIKDISFTSLENGWACGVGGNPNGYQIHRTTDGGGSWYTKHFNSPTLWSMQKILFKNSTEGWATDWDTLYYTSDGGEIWNVSGVPNFNDLTDLVMFGSIGYASRLIGKIEKTTDYGNSWNEQSTAPANFVTDIEFINENIGWAVGWNGMIYKTTNGGVTSLNEDNQITAKYNKILVDSVAHIYALDAALSKVYSDDVDSNGLSDNWKMDYSSSTLNKVYHFIVYSDSVQFIDSSQVLDGSSIIPIIWIDSDSLMTIANNNGGRDFISKNPNCLIEASLIFYLVPPFITNWFVDYTGTDTTFTIKINAENGEIITSIFDKYEVKPDDFIIYQNYPNPFNPSTKIKFVIPKSSFVNLKVYDVLGREVATLVNEEKSVGEYEVEFDGSNLSSGIYFYVLNFGDKTLSKKMCLTK